jgi:hypothetical protein
MRILFTAGLGCLGRTNGWEQVAADVTIFGCSAVLCCAAMCCKVARLAAMCCAALRCAYAGEHVVVPLLCLSGAVPCPASENGPSSGRIMVNLDLTNAQPAPGVIGGHRVMTVTQHSSLFFADPSQVQTRNNESRRRKFGRYLHRNFFW